MNKELEALERLWEETKGNPNTSSMSNRSDRDLIKQALSTQVSGIDVGSSLYMIDKCFDKWSQKDDYDKQDNLGYFSLLHLKTKFAQMEREIAHWKYLSSTAQELGFKLTRYKQLLDEIELLEDELGWYIKVGTEREYISLHFYNILKQLKSIGSDENE